jgi:hypothetical protein
MNGDRWQLPDGRHGIECGRTRFLLRVIPLLDVPPFMAAPEFAWRSTCEKQPSRYLHGAISAEPNDPQH